MRFLSVVTLIAVLASGAWLLPTKSRASDVSTRDAHPKIRAITAFIDIDAKNYPAQIESAVSFLNKTRDAYQANGFNVAHPHRHTQPFPEYTRGLGRESAIALLHAIDDQSESLDSLRASGPLW